MVTALDVAFPSGTCKIQAGSEHCGAACQLEGLRHRHHCHLCLQGGAYGALLEPLCKPCWTPGVAMHTFPVCIATMHGMTNDHCQLKHQYAVPQC